QRGHLVRDPGLLPAVQTIGLEPARSDAGRWLRHVPGALSDRAMAAVLAVRLQPSRHRQGRDRFRAHRSLELGADRGAAEVTGRDAGSLAVIARSKATKQSILSLRSDVDCFASLAMTREAVGQDAVPLI